MKWFLYLDDIRKPRHTYGNHQSHNDTYWKNWTLARSSEEAKQLVLERGMPELMSLDHDLGGDDTTFVFLHWLTREYWNGTDPAPRYRIHSANPEGCVNLEAFMKSWRKSASQRHEEPE